MARTVFLIGIGGTGMRCLESFVHTCAMGMYDNTEVHMLALDTDNGNGNFKRLKELVDCYRSVNGGTIKQDTFFSAKLNYYEFSPGYTDESSFDIISKYSNAATHRNESPTADLIDLFIDEDVRQMNLNHGYRAQTQMGSMLMYYAIIKAAYEAKVGARSDARNDLREFISSLNASTAKMPVFVFGSVFGGTGASSIPIIPLAFNKASKILGNEGNIVTGNHFGTIVLTNYFKFDVNQSNEKEVVARSENFAINSQAALMFYNEDHTVRSTYKRLYLLGRSSKDVRDVLSAGQMGVTGGEKQKNPADYIELLAAFGAYNFFKEADKGDEAFKGDNGYKFLSISHDFDSRKLDFSLFAQEDGDILKRKFGITVAASLLDLVHEFFYNIAKAPNMFVNVKVDGEQFANLKKYWGLFNLSADANNKLVDGWVPQMYHGRGGEGILLKESIFACDDLKSLEKIKFNKDLYAGDNPPQFNVGLFDSRFSVVKDTFNAVLIDRNTNMDDLLARTYAALNKLYFKE